MTLDKNVIRVYNHCIFIHSIRKEFRNGEDPDKYSIFLLF